MEVVRWIAARVRRLSDCGCKSKGMGFVLDDFLLPPSTKDVGPSTAILLHGGDSGREVERCGVRDSASFLFLFGGPPFWFSQEESSMLEACWNCSKSNGFTRISKLDFDGVEGSLLFGTPFRKVRSRPFISRSPTKGTPKISTKTNVNEPEVTSNKSLGRKLVTDKV